MLRSLRSNCQRGRPAPPAAAPERPPGVTTGRPSTPADAQVRVRPVRPPSRSDTSETIRSWSGSRGSSRSETLPPMFRIRNRRKALIPGGCFGCFGSVGGGTAPRLLDWSRRYSLRIRTLGGICDTAPVRSTPLVKPTKGANRGAARNVAARCIRGRGGRTLSGAVGNLSDTRDRLKIVWIPIPCFKENSWLVQGLSIGPLPNEIRLLSELLAENSP